MEATRNRIRIDGCPECGESGEVVRPLDEYDIEDPDTFVVVHIHGTDGTPIEPCGPFTWNDLLSERPL